MQGAVAEADLSAPEDKYSMKNVIIIENKIKEIFPSVLLPVMIIWLCQECGEQIVHRLANDQPKRCYKCGNK